MVSYQVVFPKIQMTTDDLPFHSVRRNICKIQIILKPSFSWYVILTDRPTAALRVGLANRQPVKQDLLEFVLNGQSFCENSDSLANSFY